MSVVTMRIAADVGVRYPDLLVGGFCATNLAGVDVALLRARTRFTEARAALQARYATTDALVADERIRAWRDAIRSCGLKPSEYRSSVEQLCRRLIAGRLAEGQLPLVDAYCYASAVHRAPLGAYDTARLPGPMIELRYCQPATDRFVPLGGSASPMPLQPSVVVYACTHRVLCYAFNHRDSAETCLTPRTNDAVFIAEAITPAQHAGARNALIELAALFRGAGALVEEPAFATPADPTLRLVTRTGGPPA
jgi:DNA/RNA-binding domain of Phe-tRNA-synthetase-like protein